MCPAQEAALDARFAHASAALADRFYRATLLRKTFRALHSVVENKWRRRVERACQVFIIICCMLLSLRLTIFSSFWRKARAEQVCEALRADLGGKNAALAAQLSAAHGEMAALKAQRVAQARRPMRPKHAF